MLHTDSLEGISLACTEQKNLSRVKIIFSFMWGETLTKWQGLGKYTWLSFETPQRIPRNNGQTLEVRTA